MRPFKSPAVLAVLLVFTLLFSTVASADTKSAAGNTTFTVTAVGKKDADVSNIGRDDV